MTTHREPASYRDPRARVVYREDQVFRLITDIGESDYLGARTASARLADQGLLLPFEEVPPDSFAYLGAVRALRHPRLNTVTYPYEWSFRMLQDAALLHLDLHMAALEQGVTLSDGTAYNVQFQDGRPVFIDCTSLIPYRNGTYWAGYDQFCRQFLNPLLLTGLGGIPFQPWYRGAIEGLPSAGVLRAIPRLARWSPPIFLHLGLHARAEHRTTRAPGRPLPAQGLRWLLRSMRRLVARLKPPPSRSLASRYEANFPHSEQYRKQKEAAVAQFMRTRRPGRVFDLGCNQGTYSFLALREGARSTISVDADPAAIDALYREAKRQVQTFYRWCRT